MIKTRLRNRLVETTRSHPMKVSMESPETLYLMKNWLDTGTGSHRESLCNWKSALLCNLLSIIVLNLS